MNERIEQLADQAIIYIEPNSDHDGTWAFDKEKFAELIVKMCADYADMAQDAGCKYAGDYVAEAMGYGEEEGVVTWRAK